MTKPEQTSARVAKIAGRVLSIRSPVNFIVYKDEYHRIMWGDVLALAGSVLTQAPHVSGPKARPSRIKRGKGAKKLGKWTPYRPLRGK